MGIELQFLNLIQEIRTTFLDVFMSNVTKLGNVGFIWILLTIILLVIPKTGVISGYIGYKVTLRMSRHSGMN